MNCMKIIRREGFDYRGKQYEIIVENAGSQIKATAMRNGKRVKDSEVLSGLEGADRYDSTAGMKSVDLLIGLAQHRVRQRVG